MFDLKSDAQLRREVLAQLARDRVVDTTRITVSARDGAATLAGCVPSYAGKLSAERDTWEVSGANAVFNKLAVEPPPSSRRSDAEIARAAHEAIRRHVRVRAGQVTVTATKGHLILAGHVSSHRQREAAEQAVMDLPGIRELTNLLQVRPPTSAAAIREAIKRALVENAETEVRALRVHVRDGVVTLGGTIHCATERELIGRAAALPEVRRVQNELTETV